MKARLVASPFKTRADGALLRVRVYFFPAEQAAAPIARGLANSIGKRRHFRRRF